MVFLKTLKSKIISTVVIVSIFISCEKKQNEENTPITNNDYYGIVTYGGETYTFNGDDFKGNHNGTRELGGFISPHKLITSSGLGLGIILEENLSNSDIQNLLVGKKIFYNGKDGPFPSVTNTSHVSNGVPIWSVEDPGLEYYIQISSIENLGANANMTRRKFAVRGTFSVLFELDSGTKLPGSGEFYMQWGTDYY